VVSIYASHLLLRRPWQFDRKAKHVGFKNMYSFEMDERTCTLASLSPGQVYEDQIKLIRKNEVGMII